MNSSMTTHERVSQDMTCKASPQDERISTWLIVEMKLAGSKDLPIHIDTDIKDDDHPFGPQRKQFLLTDEKKRMIANELDKRRQIYKIRKIRKQEWRRSTRMGDEERRAHQEGNRFLADLPAGLILEVIRHTRLGDLQNILESGGAVHNVFRENKVAVSPRIEAAQLSELEWLFGSGRRRSGEQMQALKDYIGTHQLLNDPERIPETFDKIEKGEFAEWSAIHCLRYVNYGLTEDVKYHKSMGIDLSRRSALCLQMFSSWEHRVEAMSSDQSLGKDNEPENRWEVTLVRAMPMKARLRLFESQPAAIQANIRDVLVTKVILIMRLLDAWPIESGESGDHPLMGQETREWIARYYSPKKVGRKMKQASMGLWIAKLAAGYILETLLPAQPWLEPNLFSIADHVRYENGFFKDVLAKEFMISGSTDRRWKESRDFAELIGLNLGWILEGTAVGEYLNRLT